MECHTWNTTHVCVYCTYSSSFILLLGQHLPTKNLYTVSDKLPLLSSIASPLSLLLLLLLLRDAACHVSHRLIKYIHTTRHAHPTTREDNTGHPINGILLFNNTTKRKRDSFFLLLFSSLGFAAATRPTYTTASI